MGGREGAGMCGTWRRQVSISQVKHISLGSGISGEGELFAVSLSTPRGPIYFLAPEKGEEVSRGGEELREHPAALDMGPVLDELPFPQTQLQGGRVCAQDLCAAKGKWAKGACVLSLGWQRRKEHDACSPGTGGWLEF